jgi:hypothetical protein
MAGLSRLPGRLPSSIRSAAHGAQRALLLAKQPPEALSLGDCLSLSTNGLDVGRGV